MRKLFDVKCTTCDTEREEFGYLDDAFRCGECGAEAKRIISPVRCLLDGASGDFPGESLKWERRHNNKDFNQGGSF